jgi:hypothetical protein
MAEQLGKITFSLSSRLSITPAGSEHAKASTLGVTRSHTGDCHKEQGLGWLSDLHRQGLCKSVKGLGKSLTINYNQFR